MVLALADTSEQHWLLGGGAVGGFGGCSSLVALVIVGHVGTVVSVDVVVMV